ncbi:MAG: hypothetical protein WBA74_10460 [Cyclobacteriaceae bacterium]
MSDVINPLQSFTQGFGAGTNILQTSIANQQAQQQIQQNAIAQQQSKEKAAQLNKAYGVLQSGNATAQDYANLASMLPEDQSKPVREAFGLLTEDQQRNALKQTGQIFSAFKSGRADVAQNLIKDLKTSYLNSGDEQGAKLMQTWSDIIDTGPEGVKQAENYFGFTMAQIPGGEKVIESAIKMGVEARNSGKYLGELKQQGLDAGLTKAQTTKAINDGVKVSAETAKILLETKAMENAGGLDPETVFNQEEKIRKEYQNRISNYTDAKTTYANIDASSKDNSGAGDVALVTSFMKMLDPGSVVRETEFATASNTAGLIGKLSTTLDKLQKGEFLTDSQRKTFVGLAKKYMDATEVNEKRVRKDLSNVVTNYNLNPDNVFGTSDNESPTDIAGLKKYITENNEGVDVRGMSEEELKTNFPKGYAAYTGVKSDFVEVDY